MYVYRPRLHFYCRGHRILTGSHWGRWLFCFASQEGDEEEEAPVVVVQLGYGGGEAWGVSPEAGVARSESGSGVRPSWKDFREDVREFVEKNFCYMRVKGMFIPGKGEKGRHL